MKIKRIISCVLLIIALVCLGGCSEKKAESVENSKKIIAVTIQPQATFVEKVCGEKFQVVTLIPPGASPETYEPTPQEMQKLEDSVLYFSIGVPAEENFILPSISESSKTVELHKAVKEVYSELESDGGRDPHIWLSPKRVKIMITAIENAVCSIDSENEELYRANAQSYREELEKLDGEITRLLGEKSGSKFIAFHPAFGYFADDYDLEMYALEEHGKEATAKRMAQIADLAKDENIKVIFYQAETSDRQASAFAEEIGGKAVSLEPLAKDYTANLKKMAQAIAEAVK